MSEELKRVGGHMASDSNWWDYTVSCSREIFRYELNGTEIVPSTMRRRLRMSRIRWHLRLTLRLR
jgi:hypothetical protein